MSYQPDSGIIRHTDDHGRVWFSAADAIELMLRGVDVSKLRIEPSTEIAVYNEWCDKKDKSAFRIDPPDDVSDTQQRLATWHIPDRYLNLDVRQTLLDRCETDRERDRINMEMDLYENRELLPVLRLAFALVDHFRSRNIIWGVGRGSSVASYVLFLIGLHKIDALAYDLNIHEFLRERTAQ